ncbi:GNAT family N-acetyltransferase [Brevibacillus daliensis]|uniref:GNAT family N-acetyltransferase n=1 Tax=Brevibacillus daliensis TaxID=2892995 RepID=UPI001E6108EA|nr:GNAT family N-acetyltransferase [Brevibacillus daliensis]
MFTYKRMHQIPLEEVVQIWNECFSGYIVNIKMDVEIFVKRLAREDMSLPHSIVAYANDEPIGFVATGIRTIQGKTNVWNAGTAIKPEWRGKGVGKELIKEMVAIYKKLEADHATLEAIVGNDAAIRLYEKMGYKHFGRMVIYEHKEWQDLSEEASLTDFICRRGLAKEVLHLNGYQECSPWQLQSVGLTDGESIILESPEGKWIGYALFRRRFDGTGKTVGITLLQCRTNSECDKETALLAGKELFQQVFMWSEKDIERGILSFVEEEAIANELARQSGFRIRLEQVCMEYPITK